MPENVQRRKSVLEEVQRPETIEEVQVEQDSNDSESERPVVKTSKRVRVPNRKYAAPEWSYLVVVQQSDQSDVEAIELD